MKLLAKSIVFFIGVLLMFWMVPAMAQAQGGSLEEIKAQLKAAQDAIKQQQAVIDGLQQRLSALEQAKAPEVAAQQAPKEAPKAATGEEPKKFLTNQVGNWQVSLGGTVFANYTYQLYTNPESKTYDTTDDFNAFQLQRCYIDVRGQNGPWAFRATPDIYTATDGSLTFRAKFAYLDYKFNNAATVRGGLLPTVWDAYVSPLWMYRYQGTLMEDREHYMPTADLGLGLQGKPNKYVDYGFAVINGTGYTKPEVDKYKSFQGRVSITPFEDTPAKGLGLSLYEEYGKEYGPYLAGSIVGIRSRQIAMLSYKRGWFTGGAETMWTRDLAVNRLKYEPSLAALKGGMADGQLWNAWAVVKFPNKWGLMARYDHVDPSTDIDQNSHWRGIFGVSYDFSKAVCLLLDEDFVQYQEDAKLTVNSKQSNLSVHLQLLW